MPIRKKIIQVSPKNIEKICEAKGCKRTAVYDALRYKTNSELAVSIRKEALDFYGGVKTSKIIMID